MVDGQSGAQCAAARGADGDGDACTQPHSAVQHKTCVLAAGGLPDLLLWRVADRSVKMVEVKGPRDRL